MRMSTNTFRAFVKHLNKHNQIEVKVKMYSLRQMHLLHKSWESHQFWIKSLWHQAQQLLVLYLRICFLIYVEEKSYLPKTDLPWGQFSSSTFLCSATMGISTRSVVKPVFQETNTIFHVVKMDNFLDALDKNDTAFLILQNVRTRHCRENNWVSIVDWTIQWQKQNYSDSLGIK